MIGHDRAPRSDCIYLNIFHLFSAHYLEMRKRKFASVIAAAAAASVNSPGSSNKGNEKESAAERSITHYRSSHKILLVGEGDFSFSTCIAKAFGSARNITATSLDSNDAVMKYRQARENLKRPEELGCTILHEVDALSMNHHPALEYRKFDRIIFNFPHAGFYFHEHHRLQIQLHRDVVRGFFRSARQMVTWNGQVHVTYKTTQPFSLWNIESLAEESGLRLLSKAKFSKSDKPSYDNKRGDVGRELTAVFRLGSVTLSCSPSTGVPDTNLEVTQLVFGSC